MRPLRWLPADRSPLSALASFFKRSCIGKASGGGRAVG
ncbi:hypothetical protein BN2537_15517 [Streptomyces venezuelae]|nr:hypothetical protein BN2537_15517 [Streptomyces venezuelae]